MTAQLFNNISDVLLNPVDTADTEIQIQSGNVPSISPGDYTPIYVIRANGSFEIMHVTAVSGTTLTVLRAQEGTDPLVFESGVSVQIRPTRQSLLEMKPDVSEVTTSTGTQTLVDALDDRWISGLITVSDMDSAADLAIGNRVRTSGYSTSGDGGGNDYEIVAAGTGTADGGSLIDLTASGLQARALFPEGIKANHFGSLATLGEKIKAAMASLPAQGGTIDATNFNGVQVFGEDIFSNLDRPCHIIFGAYTVEADIASSVQQKIPSNVTIDLRGTTFQPSAAGQFPAHGPDKGYFNTRVLETTCSTTGGVPSITVNDPTGIEEGCLVGIDGGETDDTDQQTTLSAPISDTDTTIPLTSSAGFNRSGFASEVTVVSINGELVTYTGISANSLTGATRGAFGTTAASHTTGSDVSYVAKKLARVVSVEGSTVNLDRVVNRTMSAASVQVGSKGVRFLGVGTLDGRQDRSGPDDGNLIGIEGRLATQMHVAKGIHVKGWDFSGITIRAGWDNLIEPSSMAGNCRPGDSAGWTVGLLSRSNYNRIDVGSLDDGHIAVTVEDRSTSLDQGYIGQSDNNHIRVGQVLRHNNGIIIAGSDNNAVVGESDASVVSVAMNGSSTQWTSAKNPLRNAVVILGRASGETNWATLEPECENGSNYVHAGITARPASFPAGNSVGGNIDLASISGHYSSPQELRFYDADTAPATGAVIGTISAYTADTNNPGVSAKQEFESDGTTGRYGIRWTVGYEGSQSSTFLDGKNNLVMQNSIGSPSLVNQAAVYATDVSGTTQLFARDEAGNITQLSPHGFPLIPEGPSEDMAWSYYSERDGKAVNVDMMRVVRLLESLTGEKLIYEDDVTK